MSKEKRKGEKKKKSHRGKKGCAGRIHASSHVNKQTSKKDCVVLVFLSRKRLEL